MIPRIQFFEVLPFLGFLLAGLFGSAACATADETTGSESHFVTCKDDADCPTGTCEQRYCEVDGERLRAVSTLGDQSGQSTPSGGDSYRGRDRTRGERPARR